MDRSGSHDADAGVLERLEALAQQPKDAQLEARFWEAFCRLPAWYVLTTADEARRLSQLASTDRPEDRGEIRVQMLQHEGRAFVPVFTAPQRAQGLLEGLEQAGARTGDSTDPAGQRVVAAGMPPEVALGVLCGFREQVEGFLVNPAPGQSWVFGRTLADLCAFFRHERGFLPTDAIHCAVDHARRSKHPGAYRMVHEIVANQDRVWVALRNEGFAFVQEGEHLWICAYSDPALAVRACQRHEGLKLVEGTPRQLADRVARAVEESQGKIRGAVLNHPDNAVALDHRLLGELVHAVGHDQGQADDQPGA